MPTTKEKKFVPSASDAVTVLSIAIQGESPLISHRMTVEDQVCLAMLQGKSSKIKLSKALTERLQEPDAKFYSSIYYLHDRETNLTAYGIKAMGFKKAIVRAAHNPSIKGRDMTNLRCNFQVEGSFIILDAPEPIEYNDVVAVGGKKNARILQTRAMYETWNCVLTIKYDNKAISQEELIGAIAIAGDMIGVGGYRPEVNGEFGRFSIAVNEKAEEIYRAIEASPFPRGYLNQRSQYLEIHPGLLQIIEEYRNSPEKHISKV